jgi:rod shape-determining protein MreC
LRFDSAVAALSARRTLGEENDRLRELLGLRDRAGVGFVGASALYSGTPGSEGMFMIDVGEDDGVQQGNPVVVAEGLVGVVREVGSGNSMVMDWTHPDFRVSVMSVDGGTFGLAEPRGGGFRGGDRLLLSAPYHEPVEPGVAVVTRGGPGALYPRGILVGTVEGPADSDPGDAGWRRSYWISPATNPLNATHVLVITGEARDDEGGTRAQGLWVDPEPDATEPIVPDSTSAGVETTSPTPPDGEP